MTTTSAAAPAAQSATAAGYVGCTACGLASPAGTDRCSRCGGRLSPPTFDSLQTVWAWMAAGVICYVPANIYPMLRTTLFGRTTDNTIVGGVVDLARHGNYGVALVVFVASVVIPLGKFGAIAWLALKVRQAGPRRPLSRRLARSRLHALVDFIGRWSMIDVFVVAILAALVQMQFLATIRPGIAAVSFCASVVFTMLSAQAFDSRLIWLECGTRTA